MFHAAIRAGGVFTGESATAWDLSETELRSRFLEPRDRGEDIWVQGKRFGWSDAKLQIYEGPATADIDDFTNVLGPAAYEMTRVLTEVTDRFITGPPGGNRPEPEVPGNAVFVVHGRNTARREEVARFLMRILEGTPVVVLHEQPNRGRTLIEKFEASAAEAQYAVVLLTADDEARLIGGDDWDVRARQNVVFELGFFFGKLGRGRVAVLYESGVERPSDIDGLVYLLLEETGAWKLELAREDARGGHRRRLKPPERLAEIAERQ